MPRVISLTLTPDPAEQHRLTFSLGNHQLPVGLYYFSLAIEEPGDQDKPVPAAVHLIRLKTFLANLLDHWLTALKETQVGETTHLLLNLQDEYSDWVRVRFRAAGCLVQVGWSSLEGHAVNPVEWKPGSIRVRNWTPSKTITAVTVPRSVLIDDLTECRDNLLKDISGE